MKLLLIFLFVALVLGIRAARVRDDGSEADIPRWHLLVLSCFVGLAYLSLRVI
jgi:hypothetical protein